MLPSRVLLVLLLVLPTALQAADPPTFDDCKLAAQARLALERDRALEPHRLGVSVRYRAATLWGAVPERILAERALEIVRRVQGVARVIDEISIETTPELVPLRRAWPPQPEADEPPAPPTRPPWYTPPSDFVTKPAPAKAGTTLALPHTAAPVTGQGVSLLPPRLGRQAADQKQAVEELCRSSPRYRHVRAEIAGGVVKLHGVVVRGEDIFALAQAVGKLPGVERVVVDGVRIDPLLAIGE